uniref:Uncharacterized protein n=1 Tax=Cucumis melo TaxID=3656 RepID=A0A9I9DL16_CUCME
MAWRLNQRKTTYGLGLRQKHVGWLVVEGWLAAIGSFGDQLCKMWLGWMEARKQLEKRRRLALRKNGVDDGEQWREAPTRSFIGLRWMRNAVVQVGSHEGMVRLPTTLSERGLAERAGGDGGLVE